MLQSIALQRVRQKLVTKQQQEKLLSVLGAARRLLELEYRLREAEQESSSEGRRKAGHLWPCSTKEGRWGLWILFVTY